MRYSSIVSKTQYNINRISLMGIYIHNIIQPYETMNMECTLSNH